MGSLKKLLKRVVHTPKHSSTSSSSWSSTYLNRRHQVSTRLPNELIFDIFELATADDGSSGDVRCSARSLPSSTADANPAAPAAPSRQAMLATIARVSKLCRAWAEQELYRAPVISSPGQARRFKRTVDRDIVELQSSPSLSAPESQQPLQLSNSKQGRRARRRSAHREPFRLLKLVDEIILQGHGAVFHIANLCSTFRRSTLKGLGGRVPAVTLRNTTIPTFFAFAAIADTLTHLTFDNVLLADRTLTARYHPFFVTFNALDRLDLFSTKIELDTARIFLSHSMLPQLTNLTMDHVKLLKDFEEAQDPDLRIRRPVDEDASAMGLDEDVEVFDAFLLGQLETLSLAGREGRRHEQDDDDDNRDVLANVHLAVDGEPQQLDDHESGLNVDADDDGSDVATIRLDTFAAPRPVDAHATRILWTVERRMLAQCHVLKSLTLDSTLAANEHDLRQYVPSPLLT
ncbi:hypothetical protein OIV83_003631 [Microbotryomycetes sp. JL201]|nr:hypothetical protein OIV83_003631 [Microbotryomycetes sp. JL201]